jgi:hypothetical protein
MTDIDKAIRRGKVWILEDGDVSQRFSEKHPPPYGTVFIRDDPYQFEMYGHGGELVGQLFLSDEQRAMIVQFLGARSDRGPPTRSSP